MHETALRTKNTERGLTARQVWMLEMFNIHGTAELTKVRNMDWMDWRKIYPSPFIVPCRGLTKVTVFGQSKFENFNSVKKFHI